jgi:hypothetical protein
MTLSDRARAARARADATGDLFDAALADALEAAEAAEAAALLRSTETPPPDDLPPLPPPPYTSILIPKPGTLN